MNKPHTTPLTNAERQRAYKARKRAAGLVPMNYILTVDEKEAVERLLIEMREK